MKCVYDAENISAKLTYYRQCWGHFIRLVEIVSNSNISSVSEASSRRTDNQNLYFKTKSIEKRTNVEILRFDQSSGEMSFRKIQ